MKVSYPEEYFNIPQIFFNRAKRYGARTALIRLNSDGQPFPISWTEWAVHVRLAALGLLALGFGDGDKAAILSENRPEWTYADLAVLSLGGIVVPIYPSSCFQEADYQLEHSETRLLFLSSCEQLAKIKRTRWFNQPDRRIIVFDSFPCEEERVQSLQDLEAQGRLRGLNDPDRIRFLVDHVRPDQLATIIYTSGTTGAPKGVMLTHHNLISNYCYTSEHIPVCDEDTALSFLPLSHVFERLAGYYYLVFHGGTIAYARSMQSLPEDLLIIRPTVVASVPRFYEKMYARVMEKIEHVSRVEKKVFFGCLAIGKKAAEYRRRCQKVPWWLQCAYGIAWILMLRKVQAALGGRIKFFVSGGAPLAKELIEFFYAADVLILEGYGLTETSPVMAVNAPWDFEFGTVGKPTPHVEVKIAEDGEILTRSTCVMKGYYRDPSATEEAIQEGWFHTGDVGYLNEKGNLTITDRKKDMIVTSGGKNIAPQFLENLILQDPLFKQVVVVGDKRHYLVALIVTDRKKVENFVGKIGLKNLSWEEALNHPAVYEWVDKRLKRKIGHLPSFEQIKYFSLLSHDLTHEAGEVTPTFKIRRKIVTSRYQPVIDELYRRGRERRNCEASEKVEVSP